MKRAAIFGMGTIGTSLAIDWMQRAPSGWVLDSVCSRRDCFPALRQLLSENVAITDDLGEVLAQSPDAVVETAGHASALQFGAEILRNGSDLYLLSSGILADPKTYDDFLCAADIGQSKIIIPSGALAGFDGLMALSRARPATVTYRSTKPANAWRDTPAEDQFDLDALDKPTVFFRGSAREAALMFPKNANLAASVALSGVGFEQTKVELVADPNGVGNVAELEARISSCTLKVQMTSQPEPLNPKSSAVVRSSVFAALERQENRLRLG
ncbi:aspartate dehydrogenase [uncultured Parasphingorhabdus sp.]|uniref:aspartate dehydrogenase n=1 Tax=uncultured Parasphingorhabdus sp. TaxID=2709694 RepID=UPI002AA70A15|nr:aspartate dehydrogenase [uncultured Parasphingorhabdus sp.]